MLHNAGKERNARQCGVIGGVLFLLYAVYLLLSNVLLLMRVEGFFNPMALLAVLEWAVIGAAALADRKGKLLAAAAWLLAAQNLLTVGSVVFRLPAYTVSQPAFRLVLTSAVSSLASVLLAAVLLLGPRARRKTDLRLLRLLPVLVQAAVIVLQLLLVEGVSFGAVEGVSFGAVALVPSWLLVGMWLVGLWVTASQAPEAPPENAALFAEEAFPFEEER